MILVRVPVAPFPPGTVVFSPLIVPLLPGAILLPVPSASATLPFILFLTTVSVRATVPLTSATIAIVCSFVCEGGPVPAAPGPVVILLSALPMTSVALVGPVGVLIGVFMTIGDVVRGVMAIPGAASGLTRVFVKRQVLNRWVNTFCTRSPKDTQVKVGAVLDP